MKNVKSSSCRDGFEVILVVILVFGTINFWIAYLLGFPPEDYQASLGAAVTSLAAIIVTRGFRTGYWKSE